jgi:hypothetical protein
MYPEKDPVRTKYRQSGDEAEKERDTAGIGVPHGEDNSIRVNDLIYIC